MLPLQSPFYIIDLVSFKGKEDILVQGDATPDECFAIYTVVRQRKNGLKAVISNL